MHSDSPRQAHALLHKAIPLMRKMDIAPTPYNYGIWYEYVRQSSPKLNHLVDLTIGRLGSLPSFISKELFHQFIVSEEARYNNEHKDKLEELVNTVSSETHTMSASLAELQSVMDKSRKVLNRADRQKHLDKVVRYLDHSTKKAMADAEQFSSALNQVNAEVLQLKAQLDEMKNNADLDPLTQLLNQKGLERQLFTLIPSSEDDLSLLMLDIDHLKEINNQYGRRAGTALICHIGRILTSKKLDNTTLARLDGGTFAIILNEATLDTAIEYAEMLRNHLNQQRFKSRAGQGIIEQIKVSFGVATVIGQESPNNLIARASGYLDNAKRQGRNRTASR
ncbi:putative diguanylate cyclase YdaM [Marinomonas aquimarina]|uniref:diguanylate cyclase n=1 Tax=Marinomonas aquimarina TaxID=295068 RepID=A0A1A8THY4_9GAMM|nr:GGDEF domain-containing protein [Marinomonas aquimarina]SBS31733.1 putative diguanylate cyclase YdaM [Marinomonas aquimarina]